VLPRGSGVDLAGDNACSHPNQEQSATKDVHERHSINFSGRSHAIRPVLDPLAISLGICVIDADPLVIHRRPIATVVGSMKVSE
jgi:hypothetical protein